MADNTEVVKVEIQIAAPSRLLAIRAAHQHLKKIFPDGYTIHSDGFVYSTDLIIYTVTADPCKDCGGRFYSSEDKVEGNYAV